MPKKKMITQPQINQAYKIVQQDLLNTFNQMEKGDKVRLNQIGTFEKKFKKGKCTLPGKKGKKYEAYWVGFRMSKVLKQALNK